MADTQLNGMKDIANDLNRELRYFIDQERDAQLHEFRKFKE